MDMSSAFLKSATAPGHAAKSEDEVGMLLNRFYSNASRRGLTHMVTAAQTIRKRRAAILAAVRLGVTVPATKAFANVV